MNVANHADDLSESVIWPKLLTNRIAGGVETQRSLLAEHEDRAFAGAILGAKNSSPK